MISQELWAAITPHQSPRRHVIQAAIIVAIMIALAAAAWWSGAAAARLSVTPTTVEPGGPGHVRIHVELRNDGRVTARPAAFLTESNPPVSRVDPHATPTPGGLSEAEVQQVLPAAWTLRGGETRQLTLELRIACDSPPPPWRLRMVAYVRRNGSEVNVRWKDDELPHWRTSAFEAACRP